MDEEIIKNIDLENFHQCPLCEMLGTLEQIEAHLKKEHTDDEAYWMEE